MQVGDVACGGGGGRDECCWVVVVVVVVGWIFVCSDCRNALQRPARLLLCQFISPLTENTLLNATLPPPPRSHP